MADLATQTIGAITAVGLTVAGVSLGLRVDVLIAGFAGSAAAMVLLNTVPITGDRWQDYVKTTLRRISVSVGSAMCAGYVSPVIALSDRKEMLLMTAFVVGAAAMQILPRMIEKVMRK